jgi:hypothetical protein
MAKAHKQTTAGQIMRDMLVYELHLQGMSPKAIAAQDGRTTAGIKAVIRRQENANLERLLEHAPVKIVEGMLRRSQMAWRMAATAAAHAEQDGVRITAIRTMLDADERVLQILQSTGHLPNELGTLRHLVDVRHIAIKMIDAVRDLESGERSPEQVRGVFEDLLALTEGEVIEGEVSAA